jgi:acetoacetyl-CoA synthetase
MRLVEARWNVRVSDYDALYRFSIDRPESFWASVWEFGGIIGTRGDRIVMEPERMPGARFFPEARLNFAQNLLRRRDDGIAIVFKGENRRRRTLTFGQLFDAVSAFAAALRGAGVRSGDRVAGYVANTPEAIVAALGAAAVGAVWSSCSPDFGVQGVLDRFGQIEPRVLVAVDGYDYGGKTHSCLDRIAEVVRGLPTLRDTVVIPYAEQALPSSLQGAQSWADFLGSATVPPLEFEQLPFDHPLYILYSSGTTGVPKCIVHGAGGTLIQHVKEHQLHCDVHSGDRVFYFTTCGWMMWNWLVSCLASDATLLLYDGSPFHDEGRALFDFADETGMTLFGTSAKFVDAVQ